jgi:hypothetical protein
MHFMHEAPESMRQRDVDGIGGMYVSTARELCKSWFSRGFQGAAD